MCKYINILTYEETGATRMNVCLQSDKLPSAL